MANNYQTFNNQQMNLAHQLYNANNSYDNFSKDTPLNSSQMRSNVFNPSADIGLSIPINSDQLNGKALIPHSKIRRNNIPIMKQKIPKQKIEKQKSYSKGKNYQKPSNKIPKKMKKINSQKNIFNVYRMMPPMIPLMNLPIIPVSAVPGLNEALDMINKGMITPSPIIDPIISAAPVGFF